MEPEGTQLTKTRFVLVKPGGYTKGHNVEQIFFAYEADGDETTRMHELQMDLGVWRDMGGPETITVTIEPGDKLNEEES